MASIFSTKSKGWRLKSLRRFKFHKGFEHLPSRKRDGPIFDSICQSLLRMIQNYRFFIFTFSILRYNQIIHVLQTISIAYKQTFLKNLFNLNLQVRPCLLILQSLPLDDPSPFSNSLQKHTSISFSAPSDFTMSRHQLDISIIIFEYPLLASLPSQL